MSSLKFTIPTIEQLTQEVEEKLLVKPCLFQINAALAQLKQYNAGLERRAVVCFSGTGSGKTLAFIIPMLFNKNGISILITPLNILGDQMEDTLINLGINVINTTGNNNKPETYQEAATGKYRVIIAGPEAISKPDFRNMCLSAEIQTRLFSVIFDEGHCISQWGDSFREAYAETGDMHWLAPSKTIFYVTSATLPEAVYRDVLRKLHLAEDQVDTIRRSNDRSNVYLEVRKMSCNHNSFEDLRFVLPDDLEADSCAPEKFLVFFNSREETYECMKYFRSILPDRHKQKIVWLHSGMSNEFRIECVQKLKTGELWGLCCTDAIGMGLDVKDITLVVQYKAPTSLCTLMQRLGRAARDRNLQGRGILLAESKYFPNDKPKATDSSSTQTRQKGKKASGPAKKKTGKSRAKVGV